MIKTVGDFYNALDHIIDNLGYIVRNFIKKLPELEDTLYSRPVVCTVEQLLRLCDKIIKWVLFYTICDPANNPYKRENISQVS